jgi:hypothetical protein
MEYICDEMDELESKAEKGKLSMAEMQYLDTLAHTKKNLLKSDEMMENSEYSMNDGYDDRSYRNSYADEYRRYDTSMARGRNARRDSRGRYSRGNDMIAKLRDMMEDAPDDRTRTEIQRTIQRMEQM